jgi:heme exporter protein B
VRYLAVAAAVARKDLVCELRGRELVPALAQFVILSLLVANFGFDFEQSGAARLAPGVLWLAVVFAALLAFGRTFAAEREQASLEAVLLTGASPAAVFSGKAAAAVVTLAGCECVLLAGLALFFGTPLLSAGLLAALLLATIGMAALGCLFAALAVQTRGRELLLPVLALPLWIPIVVGGGHAVQVAMGSAAGSLMPALGLLLDIDILFVVAASLAARFVLDD